ncbi:AAA family ATPase [Pacificimonas flava]|uniref:AAA family ATPase n=2 Tax=Pacificimonas TaxID=1960290 RepID=A0A219B901_9SPHN|nr:AAA family ATPase [Pacificimonas flava]
MAERGDNKIKLQVANARSGDSGRGIARIPRQLLAELNIGEGAPVAIEGERLTTAIAVGPYDEDEGLDVIRLDGLLRANAGVSSGEYIALSRAEVKPATKVVFAPAQQDVRLSAQTDGLKRFFTGRPLTAGDVVATVGRQQAPIDPRIPPAMQQHLARRAYGLQEIRLTVVSVAPQGIVAIDENTEVELRSEYEPPKEGRRIDVTYDDIGGLGQTIDQVREMVELPLRHPELFQRLGVDPPKGVLLYGPPGTGKTRLARAVANESDAHFLQIAGPEIIGSQYGESEKKLREIFEEADQNAPSIIFIDEIDSIAPKRDEVRGEMERRLVATLLTLMDGIKPRQNTVVIAATNRPDAIDEALRRPGRFDREIIIGVPDQAGRQEILEIHTRGMPLAENVDLEELARTAYGFVGADLAALAREAAIEALRRMLPEIDLEADQIAPEVLEKLDVRREDFVSALKRVQPSALREIMIQAPDVSWDDIGGLDKVRQQLSEGIELPLKNPTAFRRLGIRPASGFLFYGPPGTGKTLLAKAVARESEANFISTKSSDLLSKWYGESEQQVSRLFARARQVAPAVIFIDEIDSLAPARGGGLGEPQVTERVVNTLLAEMDGLEELQSVVVVGATNRPTLLDPALLRPGRFDELVYIPVPEREGREKILGIQTKAMPLADDVDLASVAKRTERYTGADLSDLVRRAGLEALRREIRDAGHASVTMADFEIALDESRASITPETEREYEKMQSSLKQDAAAAQSIGFIAPKLRED